MTLNRAVTIHLNTRDSIGDYVISLHGNAIIKCERGHISICNGNYKLTKATKDTLTALLGGTFNKGTYFINGKAIELSSDWQVIVSNTDD